MSDEPDFSKLAGVSDAERAAILIMVLDDEQAIQVLSRLEQDELQRIGEAMVALGEISPEVVEDAVSGFVERSQGLGFGATLGGGVDGRTDRVRSLMTRAVGEVKAESLMQRIAPESMTPSLDLARWLSPEVLGRVVEGEHPQAIAVLLVQLDPNVAAQVLHALPDDQQTQIVHRVATLGPVAPDAILLLEQLLERRIRSCLGSGALTMGGPREAAEIINAAAKAVEKRVMPGITKIDKALARQIENEMFKFEHLFVLDSQAMGALLREVESDTLISALKGTAAENREVFFRAMSSRAAEGVRDEIEGRGRMKMAEVVEAQKLIVAAARKLAAEGTISFGSGGDDDYV